MLFAPKKSKFKKYQKGKSFNKIKSTISLESRVSATAKLISLESGRITTKQLIAIRFLIKKSLKRMTLVLFNISPQLAITKKPAEIRMGKGKGSVHHWVSNVRKGALICFLLYKTSSKLKVLSALEKVQIRLPIKTKIVFQ